ncbi:MAG: hypothetical protein JJU07_12315 [Natronohydrobacter sp.]|nr:hypothetical protein [Natronohydrobacter sp.]
MNFVRRCCFCGNSLPKGKEKNREHVIPQWLSKYSERQKTATNIIPRGSENPIRFNEMALPSCTKCNQKRDIFESRIKGIISRIEVGNIIAEDIPDLLLWLDERRLAYWLWNKSNHRENFSAEPTFFIDQRAGLHDSFACISLLPDKIGKGIGLIGDKVYDEPCHTFMHLPSAFGLLIKNIFILNVSHPLITHFLSGQATFSKGKMISPSNEASFDPRYLAEVDPSADLREFPKITTIKSVIIANKKLMGRSEYLSKYEDDTLKILNGKEVLTIPSNEELNVDYAYLSCRADTHFALWNLADLLYSIKGSRNTYSSFDLGRTLFFSKTLRQFSTKNSKHFDEPPVWKDLKHQLLRAK